MANYRLLVEINGCPRGSSYLNFQPGDSFYAGDFQCTFQKGLDAGIIGEVPEISKEVLKLHERAKQIQRDIIPHLSYEEAVVLAINEASPYTDEEIVANAEKCIAELQELLKKRKEK